MPKVPKVQGLIPRYTAQKTTNVFATAPRRSLSEAASTGSFLSGFGGEIADFGSKLLANDRLNTFNTNANGATLDLAGLEKSYDTNLDFTDLSQRVESDLFNIKETRMAGIRDLSVQEDFGAYFDAKAVNTNLRIQASSEERQNEIGRIETGNMLQTLIQEHYSGLTDIDDQMNIAEIKSTLDAAVFAGQINREKAAGKLDTILTDFEEGDLLRLIENRPAQAIKALDKGGFARLSSSRRARYKELAKNKAEIKDTEDKTLAAYSLMIETFGKDADGLTKAIDALSDPDFIKQHGFKMAVAQTVERIIANDRGELLGRIEETKRKGLSAELDAFYKAVRKDGGNRGRLLRIIEDAQYIPEQTKYSLYESLREPEWKSENQVKANVHIKIMNREITRREQIYSYLGKGLLIEDVRMLEGILENERGTKEQRNFYKLAVDHFRVNGPKEDLPKFEVSLTYLMQKNGLPSNNPKVFELAKTLMVDVGETKRFWPDEHTALYNLIADDSPPWLDGKTDQFEPHLKENAKWLYPETVNRLYESSNRIEGEISGSLTVPEPDYPETDPDIPDAAPEQISLIYRSLILQGRDTTKENKLFLFNKYFKGTGE